MMQRRAFTLIELLVVLLILALMTALLFPALHRARQLAVQIHCAANLKQWAWAVNAFAQDNKGDLPRRGQGWQAVQTIERTPDWFNALPPYLMQRPYNELFHAGNKPIPGSLSIWICQESIYSNEQYFFTYGMNMGLSTWSAPYPDKITKVGSTSSMVFLADGPASHCSVLPGNLMYSPSARHGGRVNIAFLDGHVASFTADEAGCGRPDPKNPEIQWVVPGTHWPGPPL
jgi:prepilin-type processing-associated H-X9-DG protein/prepilin-type N-terminal cleavage/methylation domain-containing protein